MEQIEKGYYYYYHIFILITIVLGLFFKPMFIVGLLAGLYYIFKNINNLVRIYSLLMFLVPYAGIFKFEPGSTSFFTILEIFFVCFQLFREPKVRRRYFVCVIGFCTYVLFSSIISDNINILSTLKVFMNLSLLYFFITGYDKTYFEIYISSFSYGLILASFLGLFKPELPQLAIYFKDLNESYLGDMRLLRFSALSQDPNYYSIAVITSLGALISLTSFKGLKLKSAICFLILSVFGMTTYSKSFILSYLFLVIIIFSILFFKRKIGKFFFTSVFLSVFLSSSFLAGSAFYQRFVYRFSRTDYNDVASITTSRSVFWENYFEHIFSNVRVLLFGEGIGAPYVYNRPAHNMYIETWYLVGLVGLLLFFLTVFFILRSRIELRKTQFINGYLLYSIFVMYFFLNGFTAFEFPFYMMFGWIVLNTDLFNSTRTLPYKNL